MKKIAIMGSGNGSNFESIIKYFNDKNVEITCLSDVEKAFILERAEKLGIKKQFLPFEQNFEYFSQHKFDLVALAGYMRILPENVLNLSEFINLHPSLLPAFKGKDAISRAFLAGVKVSGITIHWAEKNVDEGKIIAQYPVIITNDMHFDEFEAEIHALEHKLYPIVIETILSDKVFDFKDLLKSSCSGGCGKCRE
ncbi:MAG: formyltransferase family protein [Candidatus Gastranaerophilales bacterium]|nr:formyltransferase family protein [Candidatus Gastranaerophilales bacterium]